MRNQFQLSTPKAYRATSLDTAVEELFEELVAPLRKSPAASQPMTLWQLRGLIKRTIKDWAENDIRIREGEAEQVQWARHYADFWLAAGAPGEVFAAFLAIPDDPEEWREARSLRDAVYTLASVFHPVNPRFKVIAVFPPDSQASSAFLAETQAFLGAMEGVIVTRADGLSALRSRIVPASVPVR